MAGKGGQNRRLLILVAVILCIVLFVVGILIGRFAIRDDSDDDDDGVCPTSLPRVENEAISQMLIDEINALNIEENLRLLTSQPLLAGTPAEKESADMLVEQWTSYGFDSVRLLPYDVLLAYPDPDNPNKVMITENGEVNFTSALSEPFLRPEDEHPDVVPPFSAYSAQGEPEGPLVYVNYGRADDFEWLAKNRPDINLTGSIVIARYGQIHRGNKVVNAQKAGAIGVILYSDPSDYAHDAGAESTYPNGWWLPDTGAARGSVFVNDANGDPLTPGYPSKPYSHRLQEAESDLPTIPVHPISYGDALYFLRELDGDEVPSSWAGRLNITYRLGPGFVNPDRKVKMSINTVKETRTIYNVIGTIEGAVEPDRYVIVGSHRDAWVFGAVDPSSATAVLMETARVYGQMLNTGWRPRRTMMFCSWGAEEYGLIGSTEFVEEYQRILSERAVAYINTDIAVGGNYSFVAAATPIIQQALLDATKKVPDAITQDRTVYDVWLERVPDPYGSGLPYVFPHGPSSDHFAFIFRLGVPYTFNIYIADISLRLPTHPVYHSAYETFYYVKTFLDWSFLRHQATARINAEFARDLADSVILPFGCVDVARKLRLSVNLFQTTYGSQLAVQNITLDYIESASTNFTAAASDFESKLDDVDLDDALAVRRVNDQMMQLERAFIDPAGLPGREWTRHVISAPSNVDSYSGSAFPAVVDALFQIDDDPDQETRWDAVQQQLAIVAFTIQSAASTLNDVTEI